MEFKNVGRDPEADKRAEEEERRKQIEQFLKNGGEIETLPAQEVPRKNTAGVKLSTTR